MLKYRQRKEPIFDLAFGTHKVKAEDVHFVLIKDDKPNKVGIFLFLEQYTEDDPGQIWKQIGYLFLDQSLGEYDVETYLGVIDFYDRQSKYFDRAKPITELATDFDAAMKRR